MWLRVLGASGSSPGAGQPCSGHLVGTDRVVVLVDAGFGVATALTGVMDPADLAAVVITHRHLDHCIDVLGLLAVLRGGDRQVPLHVADEVLDTLGAVLSSSARADLERVLPPSPLRPGDRLSVGDLAIEAVASNHPVPTVSLRIEDDAGAVLAYSADSGGDQALVECARNADAFLVEASWQVTDADRWGEGHMTAAEAARIGREAAVRRLLLTHLRPHLDPAVSVEEAADVFDGPVRVVTAGDVIEVVPTT